MRVCLVTGEYPPMRGGVADYTAFLAEALARKGVDVSVITGTRSMASAAVADSPPSNVVVYPRIKDWGWRGLRETVAHVEGIRPDVVHIQFQTGAFDMKLGVHLFPWWLRLNRRLRTVATFHDLKVPYLFPKAMVLRNISVQLLAAGVDAVIATNHEDLRILAAQTVERTNWRWGRRKLAAVPIGSNILPRDLDTFDRLTWRRRLGLGDDHFLLSYFGFINPAKGIDRLTQAFVRLRSDGRNVHLLMVGGSAGDSGTPSRQYEQQIRQSLDNPVTRGWVHWTGFTDARGVTEGLAASDVCVLPFVEGASLRHGTLVAAIVHGLPVVTTPGVPPVTTSGLPILVSGNNVLFARENQNAGVDGAVASLLDDPKLRAHLAAGAKVLANQFDWDTIAERTLRLYQAISKKA